MEEEADEEVEEEAPKDEAEIEVTLLACYCILQFSFLFRKIGLLL